MTAGPVEPRAQRAALGSELRRLRTLAGLSGREIARRTGISQATVSRMENGETIPSIPQIRAWAKAVELPAKALPGLVSMTESALNEVTTWRDRLRAGLPEMQRDVRVLESTTRVLRNFQPVHVPGLLQTEDYARCILGGVDPGGDIESAVAVRLERQAIILDPSRRFEFVMTEAALRFMPATATPGMLAAQYDRIAAVAALAHVAISVIPLGAAMTAVPRSAFVVYDERDDEHQPFVIVELSHAAVYVTDLADIDVYRRLLAALRQSAVSGRDAVSLIQSLATERDTDTCRG